jgi:hypothetical protein
MNKTPAPTEHVKHPLALFPPHSTFIAVGSLPSCRGHFKTTVYRHVEDRFVFEKRVKTRC